MAGTIETIKPTFNEMLLWRDQLQGEWTTAYDGEPCLNDQQDEEEALYFQHFKVEAPGGKLAVKTGSAPADVDAAIDSLTPTELLVKVKPARAKEKYKTQAEKLQRMAIALLRQWRRGEDRLRMIASDMAMRRYGVARVLVDHRRWPTAPANLDEDAYEDWEIKNRRACPIILDVRNPRQVRWMERDGYPYTVVEHYETTVQLAWDELSAFPNVARILHGLDLHQTVTVSDVWRGRWRSLMINDMPVFPGEGVLPHGYLDIPYVFFPFRKLHFEEPERRMRGMLTNAKELYPLESNVLSMHTWMLAWNAWRTYKGWIKDGRAIEILPGQIIPLDQRMGEYLEMLEGNPVPPELLQTAAVVDQYIQRNGVAQGPRSADGTRSAQQVWALQSMRQLKIEAAKQSLKDGITRCLELAAMEIELNLRGEPLTLPVPGKGREGEDLGEVTIRPKDIDGYWDGFEVNFGRRLDPAVLEQAKALMGLAAGNWMPLEVSWELSGLTDSPQEWEDMLNLQAVDRLPFIVELAGLQRAINWYGEDHPYVQQLFQRVMASRQQQAPGAMPGSPGAPSPGAPQPTGMHGGGDTLGGTDAGLMNLPQPGTQGAPQLM